MSKEAADLKEYELGGALRSNSSKIEKSAKMLKTSQKWHVFRGFSYFINPIPHGIWNNVSTWGGAIMAPPSFLSFEATKSPKLGLR